MSLNQTHILDEVCTVLASLLSFFKMTSDKLELKLSPDRRHYGQHRYWIIWFVATTVNKERNRSFKQKMEFDADFLAKNTEWRSISLHDFNAIYRIVVESIKCQAKIKFNGEDGLKGALKLDIAPELSRCDRCKRGISEGGAVVCPSCANAMRAEELKAWKRRKERLLESFHEIKAEFEIEMEQRGFKREFRIERDTGYIRLDFYHPSLELCIELDGGNHFTQTNIAADRARDRWLLMHHGISTVRFRNKDVKETFEETLGEVDLLVHEMSSRMTKRLS